MQVGHHDDGEQRLAGPAAPLEQGGEPVPVPQPGAGLGPLVGCAPTTP